MIIGMYRNNIPIDLILFSDTGGEQPETYGYLDTMNQWLSEKGLPKVTSLYYTRSDGSRMTLEEECLSSHTLPAIAYGRKACSMKYKIEPQERFLRNYPPCKELWKKGERPVRFIGYDAGEMRRRNHAIAYDIQDKRFAKRYPLCDDWFWTRDDCKEAIRSEGLPLPGKSSCFFCPSMKKAEIRKLKQQHPELIMRALAIENNAMPNLKTVKGLGRNWAWRDFLEHDKDQVSFCDVFEKDDVPCGCYD